MFQVLFFGELKELTACTQMECNEAQNTYELRALLVQKWPVLSEKTFVLAVNRQVVHDNIPLQEGDEVALLPPFSGG